MPNVQLSDNRWVEPKYLCTNCNDGIFVISKLRTIVKHFHTDMYNEEWKCDKCGATSVRWWTR